MTGALDGPGPRTASPGGSLRPAVRIRLGRGTADRTLPARILRRQGRRLLLSVRPDPGARPGREASSSAQPDFQPGETVRLLCRGGDAAYRHTATVLSRPSAGKLIVALIASAAERVQQRQYFRMRVRFPLLAEGVVSPQTGARSSTAADRASSALAKGDPVPAGLRAQLRLLPMKNLSGGGCLCGDPGNELESGRLYRVHLCLPDGRPPLPVEAQVVRRTRIAGQAAAGLQFVGLQERDRERIVRTLFDQYRQSRSQNSSNPI